MATRKILLIDDDLSFYGALSHQLTPYGLEVHQCEVSEASLDLAEAIAAEIIVIAVDLPEKAGFAICHKAKKSLTIPVVLKTSTLPLQDFERHRHLKAHADGYLDQRTASGADIVAAIGALVGLAHVPDIAADAVGMEAEVLDIEELDMDEVGADGMQEAFIESDDSYDSELGAEERTRVAPAFIDPGLDEETDAAFAAMGLGDESSFHSSDAIDANLQTMDDIGAQELGADLATGGEDPLPEIEDMVGEATNYELELDEVEDDEHSAIPEIIENEEPAHDTPAEAGVELVEPLPAPIEEAQVAPEIAVAAPAAVADVDPEPSRGEAQEMDASEAAEELAALREENAHLKAKLEEATAPIPGPELESNTLRKMINQKEAALLLAHQELASNKAQVVELASKVRLLEQNSGSADERVVALEAELRKTTEGSLARSTKLIKVHTQADTARKQHAAALEANARARAAEIEALEESHAANLLDVMQETEAAHAELLDIAHEEFAIDRAEQDRAWVLEVEEAIAQAVAETEARHAEALALAQQEQERAAQTHASAMASAVEALEAQRKQEHEAAAAALAAALAQHRQDRAALEQEHADVVARLQAETSELEAALSSNRNTLAERDAELADARAGIVERDELIASNEETLANREDQIAAFKSEQDELEQQNADYQEQVLSAFQKIKNDEGTVSRAKKAMAIALTLLDELSDAGEDGKKAKASKSA